MHCWTTRMGPSPIAAVKHSYIFVSVTINTELKNTGKNSFDIGRGSFLYYIYGPVFLVAFVFIHAKIQWVWYSYFITGVGVKLVYKWWENNNINDDSISNLTSWNKKPWPQRCGTPGKRGTTKVYLKCVAEFGKSSNEGATLFNGWQSALCIQKQTKIQEKIQLILKTFTEL